MSTPPASGRTARDGGPAGAPPELAGPAPGAPRRITIGAVLWRLGLSLAVLAVVGHYTFDLGTFRELARQLNPWLLVAALGTVVTRVLFGALRLHVLSHGRLAVRQWVRSQLAWDFFGAVTPSSVGGGPFIVLFLSKDQGVPLGEATSVILFSTLLEMLWHAMLVPVLLGLSLSLDVFPEALGTVGFGALVTAFALYLAYVAVLTYGTLVDPHVLAVVVGAVFRLRWLRRFRLRALRVMVEMKGRAGVLRGESAGFYLKGFVLSVVPWVSRYLLPVFLIWSVYPALDKPLALARAAALQLGSLFLPTPGGAGAIEGLYVLFLGAPLQPQPLVAPTLLAWRFLLYYLFVFVGVAIAVQYVQRSARPRAAAAVSRPA